MDYKMPHFLNYFNRLFSETTTFVSHWNSLLHQYSSIMCNVSLFIKRQPVDHTNFKTAISTCVILLSNGVHTLLRWHNLDSVIVPYP